MIAGVDVLNYHYEFHSITLDRTEEIRHFTFFKLEIYHTFSMSGIKVTPT